MLEDGNSGETVGYVGLASIDQPASAMVSHGVVAGPLSILCSIATDTSGGSRKSRTSISKVKAGRNRVLVKHANRVERQHVQVHAAKLCRFS
jgi:hypothetical protein